MSMVFVTSCHLKALMRLPISDQQQHPSLTTSEIRRLKWLKDALYPTPPLFNPKFENAPLGLDH